MKISALFRNACRNPGFVTAWGLISLAGGLADAQTKPTFLVAQVSISQSEDHPLAAVARLSLRRLLLAQTLYGKKDENVVVPGGGIEQDSRAAKAAEVPTPSNPKERFKLAQKVNGLLGLEQPWHLKASFEVWGNEAKAKDEGIYEEWQVSAKQYRVALHSTNISVEEYGTDHGIFRVGEQDWPARPLSLIRRMIESPIPQLKPEQVVFRNYERDFGAGKRSCTALLFRGSNQTDQEATSFCFNATNTILFYANFPSLMSQMIFDNFSLTHGHYLAHDMQVLVGGSLSLKIHLELLQSLEPNDLSVSAVPVGAKPVPRRIFPGEGFANPLLIHRVSPLYPHEAELHGLKGSVVVDGVIGQSGRFIKVEAIAGPQILRKAAMDAVQQWVFAPYVLDGQAVEVETTVQLVFN